jgi:hypothetical protein
VPLSCVNPLREEALPADSGDVYSAQAMAYDNRFDGLDRRVGETEKEMGRINRKLPPEDFPYAAITAAYAARQPDTWLKRNYYWFTAFGPMAMVAIFIAGVFLGWFNAVFDGRIAAKLNEPNGTNAQLQTLSAGVATANGELKAIRTLWEQQLKNTTELKPQDLKRALPQAAETFKTAAVLKISLSQDALRQVQKSLISIDEREPGYWDAVSQFITYRSEQEAPADVRALLSQSLPPCAKLEPRAEILPPTGAAAVWSRCTLSLEEYFQDKLIYSFMEGFVHFRQCIVKYHGTVDVSMRQAVFENCIFLVEFNSAMPPTSKRIARELLASTSNIIEIHGTG